MTREPEIAAGAWPPHTAPEIRAGEHATRLDVLRAAVERAALRVADAQDEHARLWAELVNAEEAATATCDALGFLDATDPAW